MSHSTNQNQRLKIESITSLNADILLLSDLRLGNKNNTSCKGDISNLFLVNSTASYQFIANSTQNKRGVGILVKKSLNPTIHRSEPDPEENFLVSVLELNNNKFTLVAIYGPNNHDPGFFQRLYRAVKSVGNYPIIMGGDFNTTFSSDNIDSNIDCENMSAIPNHRHSVYLKEFCEVLDITDPFRVLYPAKREYSYKPFGDTRKNRSRIDFFLISKHLTLSNFDCYINKFLLATCFDHKPIILLFKNTKKLNRGSKHLKINDFILRDPDIDIVLWYTVFETYLHYLDTGPDLAHEIAHTLTQCGRVRVYLKNAGPDPSYYTEALTVEKLRERDRLLSLIRDIMNNHPVDLCSNFDLTITDDLFMEVLLNNIRNEVTSYQGFIKKFKSSEFNTLLEQSLTDPDPDKRDLLESKLMRLNEASIRDKLLHCSLFDTLNSEKMTPHFLKLAKISKNLGSLDEIKDKNGNPFISSELRKTFIHTEYAKIYGNVGNKVTVEDINEFLGPGIMGHPTVMSSRLSDELKHEMDRDLTLLELDNALKTAKLTSAGGLDGINNRALVKFWSLLRIPLHNYAKNIIATGKLTKSFNNAGIRLIPKKGDLSQLKNWRPISLLNCVYKIISRAVNNRLQKLAPMILSRAQKGFVKNRYIQECLINVIEKIAFCNTTGTPAIVLAIDQSRAFDTISHDYMTSVFRFFNFGDRFIRLMNGIGTNRTACLIWEDGTYSPNFELLSGRAQGDGPSPLQYNLGEQILLFKIELDPNIRPAFELAVEAGRIPEPLPWFATEVGKKTGKTEALADDTTVIMQCCHNSLQFIKKVLIDFGALSGLECNFDKTCIMPVGGIDELPFNNDAGFLVTNSIKLLGLEIDSKLNCLETVHEKTLEKIKNVINFWSRFWLSLPGRINIFKTLCLSQINYIGCIIGPTDEQLNKIVDMLEKFVKGTLSVSKDRLYASVKVGGLGLINIKSFIQAQQCLWVKRTFESASDNWREDLYHLTYGNPAVLDPVLIDKDKHPIISNIAVSFKQFKTIFLNRNENIRKSNLLFNPLIKRGHNDNGHLDLNFFRQIPVIEAEKLARIRFLDVFKDQPVSYMNLNENPALNITFNFLTYLRLTGACRLYLDRRKIDANNDGTCISIIDFFKGFKKGSGSVRKILCKDSSRILNIGKNPVITSFIRICELRVVPDDDIRSLFSLWATNNLSNNVREFFFKFVNNCLGINTRLSHFLVDHGRGCTFCTLSNIIPVPDENFLHFFVQCETVAQLRERFFTVFFDFVDISGDTKKRLWLGIPPPCVKDKKLCSIAILCIQYGIWSAKLKKKLPSFNKIRYDFLWMIKILYNLEKKIHSSDGSFKLSRNLLDFFRDGLH
jgi:exonuclease III